MSHAQVEPLIIAALVVTEVAVWQLRVALAARGRKRTAAALGAVNALLSVLALARVVTHMDRPANVAGYAAGVAVGVYLGIVADERLTKDPLEYRLLVDDDGELLAHRLRQHGWPVTRQVAAGADGPAAVLHVVLAADAASRLDRDLDRLAPHGPRIRSRLHRTRGHPSTWLPDGPATRDGGDDVLDGSSRELRARGVVEDPGVVHGGEAVAGIARQPREQVLGGAPLG